MQNWSVIYELSAIPTVFFLLRNLRLKSTETRASRNYYSATLFLLLVWTGLQFTATNLPSNLGFLASLIYRFIFLVVSIIVFLFVLSSIYFTQQPRPSEILFTASPIFMLIIALVIDPFAVIYAPLGWVGDFAYPVLKYSWLTLIFLVMIYSFIRLFAIRSKLRDEDSKRRMTYFASSFVLALIIGVVLYLIPAAANIPILSCIGVNFSLLPTFPAFAPHKQTEN